MIWQSWRKYFFLLLKFLKKVEEKKKYFALNHNNKNQIKFSFLDIYEFQLSHKFFFFFFDLFLDNLSQKVVN